MTIQAAQARLGLAAEGLWQAICELVLTVHEDRPDASDLAAVDDLAERVSELQGEVAQARALLSGGQPIVSWLPGVAAHLQAADLRYWRDLRSFGAVSALRAAARHRGGELPSWAGSVEASAAHCAEPLTAAAVAVNTCWQEICQPLMSRRLP